MPTTNYVAKYNGSTWSELGTGVNALNANNSITTVYSDRAGNIYAAGDFTNTNGKYYVAKWNGITWYELGALNANDNINSIYSDDLGNIYAAGHFTNASGMKYVAKWNGSFWSELGNGANALNANSSIVSISVDELNNIYAGGFFTNSSGKQYVAKWDGNSWNDLANSAVFFNAFSSISSIFCFNGMVYVGGYFTNANNDYFLAQYGTPTATSIQFPNTNPINLYPNPAKSELMIEIPEAGQGIIYNSLGIAVATHNLISGKQLIPVDKLKEGVYTICINGNKDTYISVKFAKE